MPAQYSGNKGPNRRYQWPRRTRLKNGVVGISAFAKAYHNEQETNRKQEKREDRGKRFRDYLTLLFVILTTVGIFYQAYILNHSDEAIHKSANAAKQAADVAKDTLIATNRPWIQIESVTVVGPLGFGPEFGDDVGGGVDLAIRVKNVGKSPAIRVDAAVQLNSNTNQREFCNSIKKIA